MLKRKAQDMNHNDAGTDNQVTQLRAGLAQQADRLVSAQVRGLVSV
jgi:hypothetical protein